MPGDFCVYWNDTREQFHVAKTERAIKYHENIMQVGLTYTEADRIRQEANTSYVKERFQNLGEDVI